MDPQKRKLCCISHAFARSAGENSTRTAVIHSPASSSPPLRFTYARLLSAVGSLSSRISLILQQCDDDTETNRTRRPRIVGIYLSPSVEYIVSVLSILRCDEAFLPLDPLWPEERILYAISSSNASLVITKDQTFLSLSSRVLCIDLKDFSEEKIDQKYDKAWPCEIVREYCYVIYTSGSTGKPKGVCGTEPGILNRFEWMQEKFPLCKEDFLLFKTSISFVDHLQEFLSPLLIGSTLVIPPFNELKANPPLLLDFIKEFNISRLTAVPSLMKAILPSLENLFSNNNIFNPLKILILSGEIFPIQLWKELNRILPKTTILNLYGSTEVSGDCTYFNCENLLNILEFEKLTSVPIGFPISNCDIILSNEGEIQVCGTCLFTQYLNEPLNNNNNIFKTGDFARRLKTGDLQFLGRKDRVVKINGQRISLQEIENTLMEHPYVNNAAVNVIMKNGDISHINAYFVAKNEEGLERESDIETSLRREMVKKLVPVMVPRYYFELNELPVTFSGKIDYAKLSCLEYKEKNKNISKDVIIHDSRLDLIKKAFKEALLINEISENEDFFILGGNSLLAAQIAYKLGIDMRLIYIHPTPYKLLEALLQNDINLQISPTNNNNNSQIRKKPKLIHKKSLQNSNDEFPRNISGIWAVSRSNQYLRGSRCDEICEIRVLGNEKPDLKEVWKVNLSSCVDSSPLIVCLNEKISLFIGSHSHNFLHIDALTGTVRWEVKLEGRVECTAIITSDFSQVVVGCYKGNIYFIDFNTGNLSWKFETKGEVKMQPFLDEKRNLIWCGSYDHFLYALNYKENKCFYKISCGGSIYSSPCIDKLNEILYFVSTSGLITAINLEVSPFEIKWKYELGAPAFGSLAIDSQTGNVIFCLVNGDVIALNSRRDIIWKINVGGPIFAGACISSVIPYQVLVCSRNGTVCSLDTRDGTLIWEYEIGDPITASPFVDQHSILNSNERLVCICTSSGQVHILRIRSDYVNNQITDENKNENKNKNKNENEMVREFCETKLDGDIFSSPVMICGRIFVGCRDNFVHCLDLEL